MLGDRLNMAFMNTPVTHGSGVMIVTGTGAETAVGRISGMLKTAPTLKTPMTAQLDALTLWIAAAGGVHHPGDVALGLSRGQSAQAIFTTAIALALAAVPMAMPTVLQVILSSGSRRSRVARCRRQEPRLGGDARLHVGDQLRQDRNPDAEPGHRGRGDRPHRPVCDHRHGLRALRRGAAHGRELEHDRSGDCRSSSPTMPSSSTARSWRSHRGRVAGTGPQGEAGHRRYAEHVPEVGHPPVRPDVQAHGRLLRRH